jgi:hypothetical protein
MVALASTLSAAGTESVAVGVTLCTVSLLLSVFSVAPPQLISIIAPAAIIIDFRLI